MQTQNGKFFRQIKLLRRCSKIIFQKSRQFGNFHPLNGRFHADLMIKRPHLRKDFSR